MKGFIRCRFWPLRFVLGAVAAIAVTLGNSTPAWSSWFYPLGETSGVPRLSDEPLPYAVVPERPKLPVELGCKFLGNGPLPDPILLPGGAVWSPCLWVFGTYRTAFQTFESAGPTGRNTEWVHRLDIFANLQLTTTEKCIVGFAPLDKNRFTSFTRYSFESNQGLEDGQYEGVTLRTAFCEGDFGSLFPNLDPKGTKLIDYGFSAGRQQITFQEGIMINDFLDSFGIVRNNLHVPGVSNIRITGLYAWAHLDRGAPPVRQRGGEPGLFGLFTQIDTTASTFNIDFITIQDKEDNPTGGDGYWFGLSATQRGWSPFRGIGVINTTYRINVSIPEDEDNAQVASGVLLSAEVSWTPHNSDDFVYINSFWGIDRYTLAGREPIVGGPLATFGINFAGVSLGNYLPELSPFNTQILGGVMGYQAFWDNHRRNLVLEVAGIKDTSRNLFDIDTDGTGVDGAAFSAQFQQAIWTHFQLQVDAFVAYLEGRRNGSGGRVEMLFQF